MQILIRHQHLALDQLGGSEQIKVNFLDWLTQEARSFSGRLKSPTSASLSNSAAPPERSGQVILADTSIWIDHFRRVDAELRRIIEDDLLLCHPAVIGELALGSLRDRGSVIAFLAAQRAAVS